MKKSNTLKSAGWVRTLVGLSQLLLVVALVGALIGSLTGFKVGESLPSLKLKNQNGVEVDLAQFKGKPMILYFYPKDDTSGCTVEAIQFRDKYDQFKKLGVVLFGISRQGEKSHQDFIKKLNLPFDLLIDESGSVGEALGVSSFPVVGIHKRQTLLIGPDGKLAKFYESVDPEKTADELLRDLSALKLVK